MADFDELLNKLRNPGEDGPGETIYDDLNAAYNDRVGAGDAKVTELSNAKAELEAEKLRLMARNYELLETVGKGNPTTVTSGNDVNGGETVEEPVVSLADIITYS